MAEWSQSHFLQSLGWATLNSFWQMGLLWCVYSACTYFLNVSSSRKYQLSVAAVITGFAWFVLTFLLFYKTSFVSSISFFEQGIHQTNSLLNICLISASIAYLMLLMFPSYKLFRNWQFVQRLKKDGLHKADLEYRLFTQKISAHLGIAKKVKLYVSELVASPITVGYLKPIILLPVAALNHLSVSQVEAVLLHELSHIKRYDYLVNLIVSIINTVLYFNPFIKQFMRQIEAERENCCDELVLQFGYDKVGYASALLTLEKTSGRHRILALGATGRKNLLTRIEKIVGMEKKKGYSLAQFVPVFAAMICILAFNSVLIIKDGKKTGNVSIASETGVNPFYFMENGQPSRSETPVAMPVASTKQFFVAQIKPSHNTDASSYDITVSVDAPLEATKDVVNVGYDEIDGSLTTEEKEQVKTTVDATKKVLSSKWQDVETSMADAMNKTEKEAAKREFLKEVDGVNWISLEKQLKADYDKIDWPNLTSKLNTAVTQLQLDSIQKTYTQVLVQFEKAEAQIASKSKACISPMPDESVEQVKKAKDEIRARIELIEKMRTKKVIRL